MKTPVCDFVRAYRESNALRLHMPGHKGVNRLGMESLDITEIAGADALYVGEGILRQSQENAAALFGSAKTLYSAEGSSLSLRAMLYLAALWGKSQGRPPLIAAGRNAHKVFASAAALLNLDVVWLYPGEESGLLACPLTPDCVAKQLDTLPALPTALYVTSPDYLGNELDLAGLAAICRARGILLLVDNAHGAYLRFLPRSRHPLDLGADLCCDSAHKTLPALTGAGYLHCSAQAPALLREQSERAMMLFASTSPSYLILQSLDALNRTLAEGYRERLAVFAEATAAAKQRLTGAGFCLVGSEPLKVTLAPKAFGYTGEEIAAYLASCGMVCEFADRDFLVLMLTPDVGEENVARVVHTLLALPKRLAIAEAPPPLPHPRKGCSLRESLLAASRVVPLSEAQGEIFADAALSCPPAVPVLTGGEIIDADAIRCMRYYGITSCRVLA